MFLSKNKLLLIKEETTEGQDASPTPAANAIEAKGIKIEYLGELLERDLLRSTFSNNAPLMGQRNIELSFTMEVKGSGTSGTAPKIGDMLEACGFSEHIGAAGGSSSVVYKPASSGIKSVTIYLYEMQDTGNCRLHKITGARGSVSYNFEAGKIATAEFKVQGLYNDPTDVAVPTGSAFESTVPPIVESSLFTLNSSDDLVASAVKIDMNNEIAKREDLNSATGLLGFIITGRKPSGSFNPEALLKATYDFHTDWKNATARALSIALGAAAGNGNHLVVTAPKLVLEKIGEGERAGIRTEDIPFRLAVNSADDEIELKFT
jgi:hypothetical protein